MYKIASNFPTCKRQNLDSFTFETFHFKNLTKSKSVLSPIKFIMHNFLSSLLTNQSLLNTYRCFLIEGTHKSYQRTLQTRRPQIYFYDSKKRSKPPPPKTIKFKAIKPTYQRKRSTLIGSTTVSANF